MSRGRRTLLGTLALSVLVLGAVPLTYYFRHKPEEGIGTVDPPSRRFDLVLSEAYFSGEGAARHVKGVLRNNSGMHYSNVRVQFVVRARDNALLGRISALVGEVPPGASIPFRSEAVPESAFRIALSDISSDAR